MFNIAVSTFKTCKIIELSRTKHDGSECSCEITNLKYLIPGSQLKIGPCNYQLFLQQREAKKLQIVKF